MRILTNRKFPRPWVWVGMIVLVGFVIFWMVKPRRVMDIKRLPRQEAKTLTETEKPRAESRLEGSRGLVSDVIFEGAVNREECLYNDDVIALAYARSEASPRAWAYAEVRFDNHLDLTANTLVFKVRASRPALVRVCLTDSERRTMGADELISVPVPDERTVSVSARDLKSFSIDKAHIAALKVSVFAPDGSAYSHGSVIELKDLRLISNKEFILEFS